MQNRFGLFNYDKDGYSPIALAVLNDHLDIVKMFIEKFGYQIDSVCTQDNKTAIELAEEKGSAKVLGYLQANYDLIKATALDDRSGAASALNRGAYYKVQFSEDLVNQLSKSTSIKPN
ncbi:MAG TPA: ankyrin repeat domain-containing protein [Gammaproteobacteria bacterium]|jgi:ankyrin repeat protein|nr:ankyrin repeat domain-containing protein [Gammaproteobacteria bacterium]